MPLKAVLLLWRTPDVRSGPLAADLVLKFLKVQTTPSVNKQFQLGGQHATAQLHFMLKHVDVECIYHIHTV